MAVPHADGGGPCRFLNSRTSARASAAATARTDVLDDINLSVERRRVRRHRRLLRRGQDHADLADRRPAQARRGHGQARRQADHRARARTAASCSRTTRCCRGSRVFENIAARRRPGFPKWSPPAAPSTRREVHRDGEPHARPPQEAERTLRRHAAARVASRAPWRWTRRCCCSTSRSARSTP